MAEQAAGTVEASDLDPRDRRAYLGGLKTLGYYSQRSCQVPGCSEAYRL